MSYIAILLYIFFIIFILGFFFWNTIILQRQKKTWLTFAKKHDLVYRKAGFFEASAVEGNYKTKQIGLFSEGRVDNASRGMVKYRTVIEVVFNHGMPGTGAFGNTDSMRIIETLDFGATHHPEHKGWNKEHLVTCSNREFLKEYLTPKRLDRLNVYLNMKNAVALFVFDKEDAFLRVESSDPLADVAKIESITDKLVALADDLKLSEEEKKKWIPSKLDAAATT